MQQVGNSNRYWSMATMSGRTKSKRSSFSFYFNRGVDIVAKVIIKFRFQNHLQD